MFTKNFNQQKKVNEGLLVEIEFHQSFGGGDVQGLVFAIDLGDELPGGRDEDFRAVVIDLHQGVVGQFHEILADANFAQFVINHLETYHFMEIKAVSGEFRERADREIEFRLRELPHIVYIDLLQFDDKLVVALILQSFNHIGQHFAVGFDEDGRKIEVAFTVIYIKKGTQLAFQSERFC